MRPPIQLQKMGLRRRPYAFTEHGAVMLANVLKSTTAVEMSILVVRAFIRMRQLLASQKGLMEKILAMEKKYDKQFKIVFEAIRQLMIEEEKPKCQIGFYLQGKSAPFLCLNICF